MRIWLLIKNGFVLRVKLGPILRYVAHFICSMVSPPRVDNMNNDMNSLAFFIDEHSHVIIQNNSLNVKPQHLSFILKYKLN